MHEGMVHPYQQGHILYIEYAPAISESRHCPPPPVLAPPLQTG
eukprot:COSAG06_NODE_32771_length_500_cov_1.399002_1_plen_42_part_01